MNRPHTTPPESPVAGERAGGATSARSSSLIEARDHARQVRENDKLILERMMGRLQDLPRREREVVLAGASFLDECEHLRKALREIGTPKSVPEHFDPLDWWKHTACKRGEIARDALGVTAEEMILDAE